MKQIRLLPVVIAAALALLVLKGFGIMTGGGYVLTGSSSVQAAGGGGAVHDESGETTMGLPVEPTMQDDSPVLADEVPTLALPGSGGQPPAAAHGEASGGDAASGTAAHAEPTGDAGHEADGIAAAADCPPEEAVPEAVEHGADEIDGFDFVAGRNDCIVDPGVNAAGDALPLIKDGAGNMVPLANADGVTPSENAILERLSERRDELDALEAELGMRLALVEAAEKRLEERAVALEVLEARIEAMVDEKRALEESQFVGVVAMYEAMKPKDAAAIFDELDLGVLLRVARAVNPRKMAPIMAKMDPIKAMELTAGLAVDQVEPTIEMSGSANLSALPQIVGQ